jgi:CBS domain-containing protein
MPVQSVQDLMTSDPACCTPQDTINGAAQMMVENDCGAIPVVESLQDRRLVGIITDRDIVCRIVAAGLDPAGALVHQAMTESPAAATADMGIDDCVQMMCENQVRRIPVINQDGRLVGIVAQADLARAGAADMELEDELADVVEEISAS